MFVVRTPFPHLFFLVVHPCLPATILDKCSAQQEIRRFFIDQHFAVSNNFFSTYGTVFLKLRYRDTVAFCTKNWMHEKLVTDSLQTSRFQIFSDHFQCPYDALCNKHLPGHSPSIIIAFEFFGMSVSTRTPCIFWRVRESCVCFRNNIPFFPPWSYFLRSNDFDNQQHFVLNSLWLIVCN